MNIKDKEEQINNILYKLSHRKGIPKWVVKFIQDMRDSLLNLEQENERLREALKQVVWNWEYQKRTGGKYFTSAPTEMGYKRDEKLKTEKMVADALSKESEDRAGSGES